MYAEAWRMFHLALFAFGVFSIVKDIPIYHILYS
jgi:phosphatidylglycerophosphatase A